MRIHRYEKVYRWSLRHCNTTISAQTIVIVQLQKTLQDAESREAEHQKREAVL